MRPTKPVLVRGAAGAARQPSDSRLLQLEQVIEQSGESIVVKDLDAVVTMWNREATTL